MKNETIELLTQIGSGYTVETKGALEREPQFLAFHQNPMQALKLISN